MAPEYLNSGMVPRAALPGAEAVLPVRFSVPRTQ